jgi:co-chaperonin GroES (HSP10)
MSVPRCPKDSILVKLDKRFQDTTKGGLFIDTSFRPGQYATVTGRVISTPLGASNHPQKKVINHEVHPGDQIAFSYRVIYNQTTIDNAGDIFHEDPMGSAYITKWSNANGKHLIRRKLKEPGKYDAAYFTIEGKASNVIDKVKGSLSEVNDFVGKYKPSNNHYIKYKNLITVDGEDYWKVDYQSTYIVIRDGKMIMIGGYALLEHQKIERSDYEGNLELWGDGRRDVCPYVKTKLLVIGTPLKGQPALSVKQGDTVLVNSQTVQEYNFWGKDYLLARQDQLLAKV